MFAATRPFLPFEYLRVPYTICDTPRPCVLEGFEALVSSASPARALSWPAVDGRVLATEGRLGAYAWGTISLFGHLLPTRSLASRLEPPWEATDPIMDANGEFHSAVFRHPDGTVVLPFDPEETMGALRTEQYLQIVDGQGVASRRRLIETYYRLRPMIPRGAQIAARRLYARMRRGPAFPRWPVETALFDLLDAVHGLAAEVAGEPVPWIAPWPDGRAWSLVLTHDVETADGYRRIAPMRAMEDELGYRSSWNFVPRRYQVAQEMVDDLVASGCEVGLHGLYHDGRDLASAAVLAERLPAMHEYARRWGAVGFRSPATQRAPELMATLGFEYDSSYPDTDPYEPQPGGCCSWWPYEIGPVMELPITMPQDHTLFVILGQADGSVWLDKAARLRDAGGMALLLTHPDYLRDTASRAPYRALLEAHADDPTVWRALPREVAAWWRDRAASQLRQTDGEWEVVGPAAARATVVRGAPGRATR